MSGKEPPRAPVGRVQTGMASFCKPPPTAEQREQQHLEEGQKFKQRVQKQKQRADNQQRAAEAAKHKRKPGQVAPSCHHSHHCEEEGSDAEESEEGCSEEGGSEERDGEDDGDDT